MTFFLLIDSIISKLKRKKQNKNSPRLLRLSEHHTIPYDSIWRSAIRCKMVYKHHSTIKQLWNLVNKPENTMDAITTIAMDNAYLSELRRVSEPVHFDTKSDVKSYKYNTSVYMWHKDDTIYITFHVDKHIEKAFLKKQKRMTCLSDSIYVNEFFYNELLAILNPIISYIETFIQRRDSRSGRIIVAGYSLGGIIVQIAAALLGQLLLKRHFYICCHTFGSPKAGNHSFVKWFNTHVNENYRVVNGKDPITEFPTNCHWCHVHKTTIKFNMDEYINLMKQEESFYKRFLSRYFITGKIIKHHQHDHDFDVYISRLWKYARISNYIENSTKTVEVE